jgi:hypothetical protein
MENQRHNPLAGHFRQPAIYLRLPSDGQWWGKDAIDMPVNREIAIYPMSTKDEILLRTPDALLNGQGIVDVIQSCCPSIKNAWAMPSVDVDAVLIAIRIATYGNNMKFDSKCAHCNDENTHEIELSGPLSSLTCPDFTTPLLYKDLKIRFKPQHYFSVNKSNMLEFEEQKILNLLNAVNMSPEDKAKELTESMDRLYKFGIAACTQSIEYVELANGNRVDDEEFINEFLQNAESGLIKSLQERINEYTKHAKPDSLELACQACTKTYKIDLTFDYANFFGQGF